MKPTQLQLTRRPTWLWWQQRKLGLIWKKVGPRNRPKARTLPDEATCWVSGCIQIASQSDDVRQSQYILHMSNFTQCLGAPRWRICAEMWGTALSGPFWTLLVDPNSYMRIRTSADKMKLGDISILWVPKRILKTMHALASFTQFLANELHTRNEPRRGFEQRKTSVFRQQSPISSAARMQRGQDRVFLSQSRSGSRSHSKAFYHLDSCAPHI